LWLKRPAHGAAAEPPDSVVFHIGSALLPDILLKNSSLYSRRISDREAGPMAKSAYLRQSAAPQKVAAELPKKTPSSSPYGLELGVFHSIMAGSMDLAGPGVGQVRKTASHSTALWRLMLGRQETEGVLGKSRTAGFYRTWGQHLKLRNKACVPGDGWPFRVSVIRGQFTDLLLRGRK